MVGWHHLLNGHEFEPTPGDSEGQGNLAHYSSWGCKGLDTTQQNNEQNLMPVPEVMVYGNLMLEAHVSENLPISWHQEKNG